MFAILSLIQDQDDIFRTKRRTKREPSEPSSNQAADNRQKVVLCTVHSTLAVFITRGGSACKRVLTWSQGKNGQVLGKEIYRELPSRQWPHPAQEILSAKNNWKLGKHLPDVSYMLSLLFPKHLFIVTEMNTGLDGPLIQPSITVLTSTFVGLNKHQRSVNGKGENQNLPSFHS